VQIINSKNEKVSVGTNKKTDELAWILATIYFDESRRRF